MSTLPGRDREWLVYRNDKGKVIIIASNKMRTNFLAVRANPKSPRGDLTTLDANVKHMKGHIAAQIATTCRKGQHHPLAIYLANGHEDGYTTFVAFRLIDEFMQKIGERLMVGNTMKDKSLGFQAGVKRYRIWLHRSLADPGMLAVDPLDPGRFEFEAADSDDDYLPVEEIIDGMCSVHIKRALKENQSLLPRGAPDYEHPVNWDAVRLFSLDFTLIQRAGEVVAQKWNEAGFVRFASSFRASWLRSPKPLLVSAGLGALGIGSPNHANAMEGSWPFINACLPDDDMDPLQVASIAIAVIAKHVDETLDLVDAAGSDMRELTVKERVMANQIAKLNPPYMVEFKAHHYVTFGAFQPIQPTDVQDFLAARAKQEWDVDDFNRATRLIQFQPDRCKCSRFYQTMKCAHIEGLQIRVGGRMPYLVPDPVDVGDDASFVEQRAAAIKIGAWCSICRLPVNSRANLLTHLGGAPHFGTCLPGDYLRLSCAPKTASSCLISNMC